MTYIQSSVFLALILFYAPFSDAQNLTPLPFYDSTWSQPYEPFRIAGNLYYVGTYDLACYLIVSEDGHILINSGLAESSSMIRKNVETLGFKFSDIRILLTTQAHYDHVAALAEIEETTGAKMMVHEGDAQVLADGGNSDFIFGGKGATFKPVKVDKLLKDGDKIQIGNTRLIALHHPGHTKGATSFLLDVQDEKHSWKVLIVNLPSILPQTRISGMPAYPNVGADYKKTLESLRGLKFDLWVASHASQFGLHEKRKPGDAYNPAVFGDRPLYEATVNSLQHDYDRRVKAEDK